MTVAQILAAARNNLNALSDTYWTDSELYLSLFQCEMRLAREADTVENVYSTTSVSGTDEYTKPQRAIKIWRVTYDGRKLQYVDFRHIDSINPNSASSTGTPAYYSFYDDAFYLYPCPNDAKTIKVFTYDEPNVPTSTSTLDTPSGFHDTLVIGLTSKMCPKEVGHPLTSYWTGMWEAEVQKLISYCKGRKRGDRYNVVKDEETLMTTEFGLT